MSINWTPQQSAAVEAPVADILVTAAAGSGKTQVLIGRILNRILAGQDITRLLIVTFTEAAAAEIRSRIAKALTDELRQNPQNLRLRRQLSLLPCAKISTIHSYCLGILRENFFDADLPPAFRIADDNEAGLLRYEAAELCFEKLYADEENQDFLHFTDSFSTPRSDEAACEAMLQTYLFSQSMPHPQKWLRDAVCKYDVNDGEEYKASVCESIILKSARRLLAFEARRLSSLISLFNMDKHGQSALQLKCEADSIFALSAENMDRNLFAEAANNLTFERLSLKEFDAEEKKRIQTIRNSVKKSVAATLGMFLKTADECAADLKSALPTARGLLKAVTCFTEIYSEMKRERGIIDFNDMEHLCISLLEDENGLPSKVTLQQQQNFDEIYVDEYQDSNETQEYIFSLIGGMGSGRPNIFTVGDAKQGIYGFRQANPALIAAKKETFKEGEHEPQRKIILAKNFRSCQSVIDFVNFIFRNIMSKDMGGVAYDDEEALICGALYPKDYKIKPEIHIADMTKHETQVEDDEIHNIEKIGAEARIIAARIKELTENERVYDTKLGAYRPILYSDIAVLLRNNKNQPDIQRALTNAGIPAYSEVGGGYFDTVEIRVITSLLEIIDNPINDIPLIAVMRSPIFGFNEDELAKIRSYDKKSSYITAVRQCAQREAEHADALNMKCAGFLEKLQSWRAAASYLSCSELIDFLLVNSGYMDFVSGDAKATERTANLRLLCEKARMFEKTSFKGLYSFLSYIRSIKSRGSDVGEAHTISENNNVVRIMTIHKSKGLEFPVVFLAGSAKQTSVSQKGIPRHKEIGIGIAGTNLSLRTKTETPLREAIKLKCLEDDVSEEIRVLYVALTRAKERLIITGAVNNYSLSLNNWHIGSALISSGQFVPKTFLDCICSSLLLLDSPELESMTDIRTYTPETLPLVLTDAKSKPANIKDLKPAEFEYKYQRLLHLPSKITVTELKRLSDTLSDERSLNMFPSSEPKTPAFLKKEGKISAAERGTLIHFVMQTIDLNVTCLNDVLRHIRSLEAQGIISSEEAKLIPAEKIYGFFRSPLGQRVISADKVFREEPFTTLLKASYVTGNPSDADENILVQGIIDCYFFEGDKITLIDFKTDYVKNIETIKKRYETQINAYANVLHKKYFSKIYEKFIYLFDINDIIVYN